MTNEEGTILGITAATALGIAAMTSGIGSTRSYSRRSYNTKTTSSKQEVKETATPAPAPKPKPVKKRTYKPKPKPEPVKKAVKKTPPKPKKSTVKSTKPKPKTTTRRSRTTTPCSQPQIIVLSPVQAPQVVAQTKKVATTPVIAPIAKKRRKSNPLVMTKIHLTKS